MSRFALLLAFLPSLACANELLRVFDLALTRDTQLQAAGHARDAAVEAKPQAWGPLLPQITGVAWIAEDYFTLMDIPAAACTASGGDPNDGNCDIDATPYNLGVNLNQAIYNRERWWRLQQADDRVAAAEATYRSAQQQLVLRVTEAYFNLLAAWDTLRFANAEKEAVGRQLELAKRRFEVGLSAITDVQEAQARFDLTVAQQIEAEQALASTREALAEITGPGNFTLQPLKDEIPLLGPNPDSVADWLKTAADGNFDIVAARIQAEIADKDVTINSAGHFPTLSFNGNQTLGKSSGFNQGEFADSRITLQLDVPIFSGGATQSRVRQAKSVHAQRIAELEGTRRLVERRTRDAYQGVIAGVSRVKALNQAVVSTTTALEASEVGLEVGARTAVDVLNAQRELFRTQRDHARARYDYLLNILRLKVAAGQLARKDLIEVDQLLVQTPPAKAPGATPSG